MSYGLTSLCAFLLAASTVDEPKVEPIPSPRERILEWAEVMDENPDPKIVLSADVRAAMLATKLPWKVRHKESGIEMLLVPAGEFAMGRTPGDNTLREDELPTHTVQISKPFYLGRCEVTREQWQKVMGSVHEEHVDVKSPESIRAAALTRALRAGQTEAAAQKIADAEVEKQSKPKPLPVGMVSWTDCEAFCRKAAVRLPTEAEWEYACRATDQLTSFGTVGKLNAVAWHGYNSDQRAHPVGTKLANSFGFHDMFGNMREWVSDWYGPYSSKTQSDPQGPESGLGKVLRGASWSWMMPAQNEYSAYRPSQRSVCVVGYADDSIGFRAARSVD